jgi:hypothetical protein
VQVVPAGSGLQKGRRTEMKYRVIEYGSSVDTYEVEATSEDEAEDLVIEGKGTLVQEYNQHEFFETEEAKDA